jgi:hypothetical protein
VTYPGLNGAVTSLALPVRITRSDFDSFEGQIGPSMAHGVTRVQLKRLRKGGDRLVLVGTAAGVRSSGHFSMVAGGE